MGPLLFNLFINDLNVEHGTLVLYADDTNVLIKATTIEELCFKIKLTVDELMTWFTQNDLSINVEKSKIILFGTKQNQRLWSFNVGVDVIERVKCVRFLGIQLDENLCWKDQCDKVTTTMSKLCFLFRGLKKTTDDCVLNAAYYGKVYSLMKFGVLFWGNSTHSDRVFLMQKKIVRIMFGLSYRESCRSTFRTAGLLTLPSLYIYEVLKAVFSMKHKLLKNEELHGYSTRGKKRSGYTKTPISFLRKKSR